MYDLSPLEDRNGSNESVTGPDEGN
jgi:hypothetical protein